MSYKSEPVVTITVQGSRCHIGTTTVAVSLQRLLKEAGLDNVELELIEDTPSDVVADMYHNPQRIKEVNDKTRTRVVIKELHTALIDKR